MTVQKKNENHIIASPSAVLYHIVNPPQNTTVKQTIIIHLEMCSF